MANTNGTASPALIESLGIPQFQNSLKTRRETEVQARRAAERERLVSNFIIPANTTPDYAISTLGGNAFPPLIEAHDLVAVDTTVDEFDGDGLYVIVFNDSPMWIGVRRLESTADGLLMSEDASGLPPMIVTTEIASTFQIVACIVHVFKRTQRLTPAAPINKIQLFGSRALVRDMNESAWTLSSATAKPERLSDRESMFINAALKTAGGK